MTTVTLGSTGITVNKNGFGALPVQRVSKEEGAALLRKAYEGGITFFDTARAYSDSEEKIGMGLGDVRDHIYIATKTMSTTVEGFWKDLETSLSLLKTDHVDIYQFHNPSFCPKPGDGTGLYETLQFPFCYLADEKDIELVRACREHNMGFIAMKSLSGGLITNAAAAYAFADQYDNVLPIWGIQKESELNEFLGFIDHPASMTPEIRELIDKDRKQLAGSFCRGCGYCMPCPVGIEINNCARMSLLLRRSPSANHLSAKGQEKMMKIKDCLHCNKCMSHCPYGLNTPELLARNLKDYEEILAGKVMTADNF